MASFVTYKWTKEGHLVPAPSLDTFSMYDSPITAEDLVAMDFEPQELPVDHGDGQVAKELCYVDTTDPTLIYGSDDIRNYQYDVAEDAHKAPMTDELAKSVLKTETHKAVNTAHLVKSMYNFDLQSAEGIKNILQALPMLDVEIVKELASNIWQGLNTDETDPKHLKVEIKGYLLDYLTQLNAVDEQ